jgi:DNA-binding Lrp family transcriptional regulator
MAVHLDPYDISILRALLKNGRKSFREISKETGITTPAVKPRFNRHVSVIKELEKKNGDSKSITSDANGREQYQQYLRF